MKKEVLLISLTLFLVGACSKEEEAEQPIPSEGVEAEYNEVLDLEKDKARYQPGEMVNFSVNSLQPDILVRYKYLGQVLQEVPLSSTSWNWMPPETDFQGYMVELVDTGGEEEKIVGTVAVDVSSDWTRFPRYGFLSRFGTITEGEQAAILDNLKDHHINALQYYDWHYQHHQPLPKTETGAPASSWQDIFNRQIYLQTVQGYLEGAANRNMASMFYNLLFGAWKKDNVQPVPLEWLLYKDRSHTEIDRHVLSGFGEIQLVDPSHPDWQEHILAETAYVYENLAFEGWHLDQLGDRGTLYDYAGYQVDLGQAYSDLLNNLALRFPEKKMVLNAVDQFEQENILQTPVDFAYTEVWSRYQYQDLSQVILENYQLSNGELNSVLAAYMNYESQSGTFNTPSVLMTDAVIFSFGGSHIELGEHMLSNEYFPNDKLDMDEALQNSLLEYYDFLTAYQNLLRNGGDFYDPDVRSSQVKLNNWPPVIGQVATVGKQVGNDQVIHLLNYDGASTLQWRDNNKLQREPLVKNDLDLSITAKGPVKHIWFSSPDIDGGASRMLEFTQEGLTVNIELPYLKYWSMLVLEY